MAKQQRPDSSRREAQYPYHALNQAIRLGQAVKDNGGDRADVPKSLVAQQLEMAESQSSFIQLVASTKTFGIVDGNRSLALTDQAREYFYPISDTGKELAILSFIASPPAYRFLIERFDGNRLPPAKLIANLVQRECQIAESWTMRVATMFITAVNEANIVDATGHLRYEATLHSAKMRGTGSSSTSVDDASLSASSATAKRLMDEAMMLPIGTNPISSQQTKTVDRGAITGANVWVFTEEGGTVRLETTDPLPKPLWERLKKYVDVLEPSE